MFKGEQKSAYADGGAADCGEYCRLAGVVAGQVTQSECASGETGSRKRMTKNDRLRPDPMPISSNASFGGWHCTVPICRKLLLPHRNVEQKGNDLILIEAHC
jgi:hypothetical protein